METSLGAQNEAQTEVRPGRENMITLVFADLESSTMIKAALPGRDITARNWAYVDTVWAPHRQRVKSTLAKWGGQEIKTIGDEFFLVFSSAVQAVQWAIDLQSSYTSDPLETPLGPLQVRIGMHTGTPLPDPAQPDDYIGSEVDYAHRLVERANGGQILLSGVTAGLVRDARIPGLTLYPHGPYDLPGIGSEPLFELLYGEKRPQPVRVIWDESFPPGPGRMPSEEPGKEATSVLLEALSRGRMVGRDTELRELQGRVEGVLQGSGGTVLLAGEPGVGKTRLAKETCLFARLRGCRVLTGRCDEEGVDPYQPFVETLLEYLNSGPGKQVGQALSPSLAVELARIVPQMAEWVPDLPPPPTLLHPQGRLALMEAVFQFFSSMTTQEKAVLLLLEDLHWADEGSLALLHYLARRCQNIRLLIVGTFRSLEVDPQHPLEHTLLTMNRERLFQGFSLRRLSESDVAHLVGEVLGPPFRDRGDPQEEFLTALFRQTEGNPFFIEEVLKHLVEEGALYRQEGQWYLRWPEEVSMPQSLKLTIGRRLARLSKESRDLLTLAAVMGQQFSFGVLLKASGAAEDRVLDWMEEWLRANLVVEERGGMEERYHFQHAMVREVLYDQLSRQRRGRLHGRVGLALEEMGEGRGEDIFGALAHHFSHSTLREKAAFYLRKAGQQAQRLYQNQTALKYLNDSLAALNELPPTSPRQEQRVEILMSLGEIHFLMGEHAKAKACSTEALRIARTQGMEAEKVGRLCSKIADVTHWQEQYQESIQWAEEGLALLEETSPSQTKACLLDVLSRSYHALGNLDRAAAYAFHLADFVRSLDYFDLLYEIYYRIAYWTAAWKREYQEALGWLEECLALCSQHGDQRGLARCWHGRGDIYSKRGDAQPAVESFLKSLEISERIGDAHVTLENHLDIAEVLARLERWDEAVRHAQCGIEIAKTIGRRDYLRGALPSLARYHLYCGDWGKALDCLQEALPLAKEEAERARLQEQIQRCLEARPEERALQPPTEPGNPRRKGSRKPGNGCQDPF